MKAYPGYISTESAEQDRFSRHELDVNVVLYGVENSQELLRISTWNLSYLICGTGVPKKSSAQGRVSVTLRRDDLSPSGFSREEPNGDGHAVETDRGTVGDFEGFSTSSPSALLEGGGRPGGFPLARFRASPREEMFSSGGTSVSVCLRPLAWTR